MLADAIVEVTETGSSLRANRLRIIDTLHGVEHAAHCEPRPRWHDPWKQQKIDNIALLLRRASRRRARSASCSTSQGAISTEILGLLPALQRPTISSLSDGEWVAVNTIIEERRCAT